jgi:hypothetical protein
MQKRRWKTRLADKMAIAFASFLLAVDLMIRDPRPVPTVAVAQNENALAITMILMALGMGVIAYVIYQERHMVKEHARLRLVQTRHRLELRLRFARRGVSYPRLRHAIRLQRSEA